MTASQPAAVLWDFDGTLVDSESMWQEVERGLARELGRDLPGDYHKATIGGTVEATSRLIADVTGTDRPVEWIGAELWSRARARLADGPIRWRPGAFALVGSLQAAGIPQAVVSSGHRDYLDVTLRRLDPSPFAIEIAGDEVAHNKPHPDGYLRAAAALGVAPADCLVVEDSPTGIAAGEASGAVVLAVPSVHLLSDGPGVVVLTTLAGLDLDALSALHARGAATRRPTSTAVATDVAR